MALKKHRVYLAEEAENDLYELYLYIASHDSEQAAMNVFNKISEQTLKLETMPERGNFLKELTQIGVYDFRELNLKPYRIIYQFINDVVYVHAILDGRRDLEEHLLQRMSRKVSYQEEGDEVLV